MSREAAVNPLAKVTRVAKVAPFPYRAPTVPLGAEPPPEAHPIGADYDTEWARSPAARLLRGALVEGVMRPMSAALASPKVQGLDRIDDLDGPVVFVANHHSHIDTPLLLSTIPDRWRHKVVVGAAADYFFATRATSALSALVIGAIPIERTKVGRKSADLARSLIDDGWSLLIFPEGGRSPDGWGQPFRGGAAYIAMRCGVPVVPIHVEGTGRILRKGKSRPTRSTVTLTFGAPLLPAEREDARKFAARIEREVAVLADEAATDWWQARRRAHAGATPTLAGPETGAWRRAWALGANDKKVRRAKRRWPKV
jgi:1-acyl-sn-glycerol-3-phosphate acyltransferase